MLTMEQKIRSVVSGAMSAHQMPEAVSSLLEGQITEAFGGVGPAMTTVELSLAPAAVLLATRTEEATSFLYSNATKRRELNEALEKMGENIWDTIGLGSEEERAEIRSELQKTLEKNLASPLDAYEAVKEILKEPFLLFVGEVINILEDYADDRKASVRDLVWAALKAGEETLISCAVASTDMDMFRILNEVNFFLIRLRAIVDGAFTQYH